jgi:hypothetical protein
MKSLFFIFLMISQSLFSNLARAEGFDRLPTSIEVQICNALDYDNLKSLQFVNRQFHDNIAKHQYWKDLFFKHYAQFEMQASVEERIRYLKNYSPRVIDFKSLTLLLKTASHLEEIKRKKVDKIPSYLEIMLDYLERRDPAYLSDSQFLALLTALVINYTASMASLLSGHLETFAFFAVPGPAVTAYSMLKGFVWFNRRAECRMLGRKAKIGRSACLRLLEDYRASGFASAEEVNIPMDGVTPLLAQARQEVFRDIQEDMKYLSEDPLLNKLFDELDQTVRSLK